MVQSQGMTEGNKQWFDDPNLWRQVIVKRHPKVKYRISPSTEKWIAYNGRCSVGHFDPTTGRGFIYRVAGEGTK